MKTHQKNLPRHLAALLVLAIFAISSMSLNADNRYAAESGLWDDPIWGSQTNLTPGSQPVPVNGDGAFIIPGVSVQTNNTTATLTVLRLGAAAGATLSELTIGGNGDTSTLKVSRSSGEIDVSIGRNTGTNATLNINTGGKIDASALTANVNVGQAATTTGNLNINGGTLLANNLYLGNGISSTGTLTMNDGTLTASYVEVGKASSSQGYLNVNGGTMNATTLRVGSGSNGNFTLTDGDVNVTTFYVGASGGADVLGNVSVTGGTLTINATSNARVGSAAQANGRLDISGGTVTTTATGIIFGLGSTTVSSTTGNLNLSKTGELALADNLELGRYGKGYATVADDSILSANTIYLGNNTGGYGSLTVSNGEVTADTDLVIGRIAAASGNLTQTGGNITVGNRLQIGNGTFDAQGGHLSTGSMSVGDINAVVGTLNISNGATVNQTLGTTYLGRTTTAHGIVNINDGGTLISRTMSIGFAGTGEVNVNTGGTLDVRSTAIFTIGDTANADTGTAGTGTLNIDGGSVTIIPEGGSTTNPLVLGHTVNGTQISKGTINLLSGDITVNRTLIIGEAGEGLVDISGGTFVVNDNIIIANATGSKGELKISNGALNITGNITGKLGTANIELTGGALTANGDLLVETNSSLALALAGGTLTANAIRFDITDATFDGTLDITGASAGLSLANGIIIDLSNFTGNPAENPLALLDYIDASIETLVVDFVYGTNAGLIGATYNWSGSQLTIELATIPEPSTYTVILGLAAVAMLMMRRRKR